MSDHIMSGRTAGVEEKNTSDGNDHLQPIMEAINISKSFPGVKALKDVSLRIFPGEVHALIGENGAGKSTLLKTLFGAHKADTGRMTMSGQNVEFNKPSDALSRGISMVHQELSLIPQLNAVQNVVLGREKSKLNFIDWKNANKIAIPALDKLGFRSSPYTPVANLSIAQQQIIELAKATTFGAKIIILDEPTASLTTYESEQLFTTIGKLREEGCAVIYVSHRLPEVMDMADRVTVLRDGNTVTELSRNSVRDEQHLVRLMVGRDVEALGVKSDIRPGETYLEVDQLSVPGLVKNVSLSVRRGEVLGMAGMVGAGRSEFALGLIGALKATYANVRIGGASVNIKTPGDAIRAGIAYLPEDRKNKGLDLHMTIASNVTLPNPPGKAGYLDHKKQQRTAARIMSSLSSKTKVSATAGSLSGGNQQKIVVGRWLLTDSQIYIFDEPTRGIDVGAKTEIHRIMRKLADDGKAVIMISSDLPEVIGMSDRVIVMRRGEIVAEMQDDMISEEKIVAEAAG